MIPSGPDYSAFYIFAEYFGLSYTMKAETRCTVINETHFTGGCKHIVGKLQKNIEGGFKNILRIRTVLKRKRVGSIYSNIKFNISF